MMDVRGTKVAEKRPRPVRLMAYGSLLLVSLMLCIWMMPGYAHFRKLEAFSMVMGYQAFLFIALTLLIGPLSRWLPGKAGGYLIIARRDIGIWTGLIAALHVVTVFIVFQQGREFIFLNDTNYAAEGWLGLFFDRYPGAEGLTLQTGRMGIANVMGGIAFVFLLAMWLTSSDKAERLLGGPAWKRIHGSIVLVFILAILHGTIYIHGIKGNPRTYFAWMAGIALVVLLARVSAFVAAVIKRNRGR